jgi:hypothetical protein
MMLLPKDFNVDFFFSLVLLLILFAIFLLLNLDGFHLWICEVNKVGSNLGTTDLPLCLTR